MSYSFTGIAYLILFLVLGFLSYRFFQYWKKEKDTISQLFLYFIILFGIFAFVKTIGGLFFATDSNFLAKTIIAGIIIQSFAFATAAFLLVYIKFPRISPWLSFAFILFLGLIATIFTINTAYYPFLEASGSINWDISAGPVALSILRLLLFAITFLPLIIIFFQRYIASEDFYLKRKTLGMTISLLFAVLAGSFDFLFINIFRLEAIWRDWSFIALSFTLFVTLLLTLPRSSAKP